MQFNTAAKTVVISNIQKETNLASTNTGGVEVQVALFTTRIAYLTEHLKTHKKDKHTQRGLVGLVNKRRKLLDYLKRTDVARYQKLIELLSLRR